MEDLVLTGMVLGNSFPFLLLYFSTYMIWMVLLPTKGALLLTKEKHQTRPKQQEVPFQPLTMSLQRETHHFYRGTVALLHPTFRLRQIRTVASYSINTHKISHTQSKKLLKKKKRLNRICYFRLKPEIQENSLWKHYLCRACRILCSFSKANRYGQAAKAREAVRAAVCPAVHLTSAAYSGFLQAKCIRCMDQSNSADARSQVAWASALSVHMTARKTGRSPCWETQQAELHQTGIILWCLRKQPFKQHVVCLTADGLS